MENQEYIIINKTAIQKRIEELEKEIFFLNWNAKDAYEDIGKLSAYKKILSQSTPLIPELQKGIQFGCLMDKRMSEINKQVKDYISNLKLDI